VIHEDLPPITKDEYRRLFESASPEHAGEALLRLAWHERDTFWAEQQCVAALEDERLEVRRAAATSLGHLARRQRTLNPATVSRLRALKDDPEIGGRVEDALDDLAVFVRSATDLSH